jgi:hypothetical protein
MRVPACKTFTRQKLHHVPGMPWFWKTYGSGWRVASSAKGISNSLYQGNFNIYFRLDVAMESNFVKFTSLRSMSRSKNQLCFFSPTNQPLFQDKSMGNGFVSSSLASLFPGRETRVQNFGLLKAVHQHTTHAVHNIASKLHMWTDPQTDWPTSPGANQKKKRFRELSVCD